MKKATRMVAMPSPSKRDRQSVMHYLENDGGQVATKDREYIFEKEDLVTLRPGREHAWLDDAIERFLLKWRCPLFQVRHTRHDSESSQELMCLVSLPLEGERRSWSVIM